MTTRLRRLGLVVAGLCSVLAAAAVAAPVAMAATAWGPALTSGGAGPPASAWYKAATITSGSGHGMSGWEIALIAMATALVISVGDRAFTGARAARRPVIGTE
jgi:hypothetical protein